MSNVDGKPHTSQWWRWWRLWWYCQWRWQQTSYWMIWLPPLSWGAFHSSLRWLSWFSWYGRLRWFRRLILIRIELKMMNLPARLLGDLADTERSLGHCWSAEDWDLVVIIDYHESINMFAFAILMMVWYGMGDDYHESVHNDDNHVCF